MGLLASSKSLTQNINETSNYVEDNRIAATDDATVITGGGTQNISHTANINNTTTSTTTTQVVDGGLVDAVEKIASGNAGVGKANADALRAISADLAKTSQENTQRAIDAAANAARETASRLAAGFDGALSEVAKSTKQALEQVETVNGRSLAFGETALDHVATLTDKTLDSILQNTERQARETNETVTGFAGQLFQANQSSEERQLERLAQVVLMVVLIGSIAFTVSRFAR